MSGAAARHPRLARALLAAAAVLVALVVTEAVLERRESQRPIVRRIRLRESSPGLDTVRIPDRASEHGLVADTLERKSYRYRTDEDGFLMPSRVHAAPDLTIAFLGGSTTECEMVEEGSRFPSRSGVLLGERLGLKVNALNAGFKGSNTAHEINVLFNKVLPARPDAVVLMENVNDVAILLFTGSYWNDNPSRSLLVVDDYRRRRWRPLSDAFKSAFFPALSYRLDWLVAQLRPGDEFAGERQRHDVRLERADPAAFARNLSTFVAICRAQGPLPILMTQFSRLADPPDPATAESLRRLKASWGIDGADFRRLHETFNRTVRDVARDQGVPLVDLAARLPRESRYLYDLVHLNTAGSERVAGLVADALAELPELAGRARREPSPSR